MAECDDCADYGKDEASGDAVSDGADVNKMKIVELKKALKVRKMKTTGHKVDLVERLKAALLLEQAKGDDDEEVDDDDADSEDDKESENMTRRRVKHLLTFRDVEESMSSFSGDGEKNVRLWIKEFEDTAELCEWSDVEKIIYAKRLLCGSAKLFVNYERCGKTWKQLKGALRAEFTKSVNSHTIHKELERRKKRDDESYHEYMYKMLDIASQVEMDTEAVIQYVIDGIKDNEINKAILYGAKNIRQLKDKLTQYETMTNNEKMRQKSENRPRRETGKNDSKFYWKNTTSMVHLDKRCYNCGGKNHVSANCPSKSKGTKCFKCQEFGHVAAKCSSPASVMQSSGNVTRCERKKACKNVCIGEHKLSALIDSGSDLSLIRASTYIKIGAPTMSNRTIQFRGIGSEDNFTLGEIVAKINIDAHEYDILLRVVSDVMIQNDLIIGYDFLNTVDVQMKQGSVIIDRPQEHSVNVPEIFKIDAIENTDDVDLSYLPNSELVSKVKSFIQNYQPNKTKKVDIKMRIILTDDIPVYQAPRRLSVREKEEVDLQIQTWLDEGIIRPSQSDYASPIVLVRKKDGTTRICVDYRKLNEKIVKDRYPLPLIEDQIDQLQGKRIFSTLDLKNGFFHVPVDEASIKFTAFVVPNGHYEFCRVPFGLCNSPSVFQKYINAIFRPLVIDGSAVIYLDDVIIPAIDHKDGLRRLEEVLTTASDYGLIINWKKCCFLRTRIEYLGYEIENGAVEPSDRKLSAVKRFPEPVNIRSLQSFLGLTGYFRKFVPQYSLIARPLTDLLKDKVEFCFEGKERYAFNQLKMALITKPVLKLYRPSAETELHTDASALGFGAMLLQRDSEDRAFHPVYYASGKTNAAEEKYHSYELEVLAIVKAVKKFRVYLIGIPFKIVTDCQAFTMTLKKKDMCARVARWALFLQDFNYTVEHRPGTSMRHVDALSRHPLPTVMHVTEEESSILNKLRKAQADDGELQQIRNEVKGTISKEFVDKDGLLYKKTDDEYLIVIPKLMQTYIIRLVHEQGHFAAAKTEQLIRRDYWFKAMRPKIEKVIRNCISCVLVEPKTGKAEGWLYPIEKGECPLDTFHIDHLGPLTSTKKNYKHIFLVVDAFSKFTWLYPTKSTTTVEVLDRLRRQAAIFGNPRRIISDRGSAFTAREFANYCKEEGIEHSMIATGVPRGNGQVERVNRTLIPMLAKLATPQPETWHKFVERAQQYLNNVPNRSTGMSPFSLMIGTRMRLKDDPGIQEIMEKDAAAAFQDTRNQFRIQAKNAIAKIQDENKKGYNRRRKKATKFKLNDLVAIRRTQTGPGLKLYPKFLGPYQVVKILRNDRYLVEKVGEHEGPGATSTSIDHMKCWPDGRDHDLSGSESEGQSEVRLLIQNGRV